MKLGYIRPVLTFSRSGNAWDLFDKKRLVLGGYYVYDAGKKDPYEILKSKFCKKYHLPKYDQKTIDEASLRDDGVAFGDHNIEFKEVDSALKRTVANFSGPINILFYKPEKERWYSTGYAMGFIDKYPGTTDYRKIYVYAFPTGRVASESDWSELCEDMKNGNFRKKCKESNYDIKNWCGKPTENVISKNILVYRDEKSYRDHYGSEMK